MGRTTGPITLDPGTEVSGSAPNFIVTESLRSGNGSVGTVAHPQAVKVRNLLSVDCYDVPTALARTVATTLLREGTDVCDDVARECGTPVYVQADTEFEDVEQVIGNVSIALLPIIDEDRLIGLVERNVFRGSRPGKLQHTERRPSKRGGRA